MKAVGVTATAETKELQTVKMQKVRMLTVKMDAEGGQHDEGAVKDMLPYSQKRNSETTTLVETCLLF